MKVVHFLTIVVQANVDQSLSILGFNTTNQISSVLDNSGAEAAILLAIARVPNYKLPTDGSLYSFSLN